MDAISTICNSESELITFLSQTSISPDVFELVVSKFDDDIDWNRLIRVARRNAVLPLVSWNLLNHFADRVPEEIRSRLDAELHGHIQKNMYLTGKVSELVRIFRAANIELVPFKGPMLAIRAYGNPALRKYSDLDMLVQPRHFKESVNLLKENGYKAVTSASWLEKSNWYISRRKDIYFVDKSGSVNLELHWKLSGSHFGLPTEMNGLWDRLESLELAGTAVPSLSFNDLLIYLCLHGSRHSWERFAWVCDVHELILSRKDIDWDLVFSESKRFGCENVVALGLRLVHEFFRFDAPDPLWDKIKSDPIYDAIVAEIRERLFSAEDKSVKIGERYLYHLKLKERKLDKWKLHVHYLSWYLRIILTPNEMDRNMLHLPRYLYPLYYLTRPFRLVCTYMSAKFVRTFQVK